jgi:hypothetical protein
MELPQAKLMILLPESESVPVPVPLIGAAWKERQLGNTVSVAGVSAVFAVRSVATNPTSARQLSAVASVRRVTAHCRNLPF